MKEGHYCWQFLSLLVLWALPHQGSFVKIQPWPPDIVSCYHLHLGNPWMTLVEFCQVLVEFTPKMTTKPSFSIWAYLRSASTKVRQAYSIRHSSLLGH
eukprot:g44208.t1